MSFSVRWRLIEFPPRNDDALLRIGQTHMPLNLRGARKIIVSDDLFHPNVPDGWIDLVVAIAAARPRHTFWAPTFHVERAKRYWEILATETEAQTAGRLAVAILRGTLPNPVDFTWPLPNLHYVHGTRIV